MDLRPQGYAKFPAILNSLLSAKFKSDDSMIMAALNLVSAFRALHLKGLSYQDLNNGSFFINVSTGDVRICDTDNVTPGTDQNSSGIIGTPGYMAPEIVIGKSSPSVTTDLHSLAVVLFKLFIHHDPFEGKKIAEGDGITDDYVLKGSNPVFIFNPIDNSNRPTLPEQVNPQMAWPRLPRSIQELFEKAFVSGLKTPNKRPTELEWQKALIKYRDENFGSVECPLCKKTELDAYANLHKITCKACGNFFDPPSRLKIDDYFIPLFPGKKIYAYHTDNKADLLTVNYASAIGEILPRKNHWNFWGIKNLSNEAWMFTDLKENNGSIKQNEVMSIICGSHVSFGGQSGEITFQLSTEEYSMSLYPGLKLKACHTRKNDADTKTITGEITRSQKNSCRWGLVNHSDDVWTYTDPSGKSGVIEHGKLIPLVKGTSIFFKDIAGKITG
jgi:serine/threonine protein kinase